MQYFEPAIESDEKLSPVCDVADHFGAGEPVSKPATGPARQRRVAAVSHAGAVLFVCRSAPMEMREGDSATLTALAASTKTAARSMVGFNLKRTKQEGARRILRMRT